MPQRTTRTAIAAGVCFTAIAGFAAAQTLYQTPRYTVQADSVQEGSYQAKALSRTEIESNYSPSGKQVESRRWHLGTDLSTYPQFHSSYPLVDALYNLTLEELRRDIRSDGTFMAGEKWEGVWTRDISYSILLSLAMVEPEIAKASLVRKVSRNRIVQDTGTGGSWPVSTDRMVWALAAWEIYLVTGDRAWLSQSFEIIRNSAADDQEVIFDRGTGLALGESSFLDWREQTYPRWMSPVDIYSSIALGTNAVHYRTYQILALMAKTLGQPGSNYDAIAGRIREGLNQRFWLEENGYYGQYLYGRNALTLSPRSEALGEALTVLFDIGSEKQQDRILRSVPVMDVGIPSIYPQTPGIPPYHNNAVWPFVQAFWNLAAAKRHDGGALLHGLAAMYRASSLFLTNQENLVASTGSSEGTEINSPRQLWSVAGNLAMVYRVFAGLTFEVDGLHFHPVIPKQFAGPIVLDNFRYRQATLKVTVEGYGSDIATVVMDGKALPSATISPDTSGAHEISIQMKNDELAQGDFRLAQNVVAPETPSVTQDSAILHWAQIPGADHYVVVRNGERVKEVKGTSFTLTVSESYSEYQVSAVDGHGVHSFLSEPLVSDAPGRVMTLEAESFAPRSTEGEQGYSGTGFIELSKTVNGSVTFAVDMKQGGTYAIDFRYANGSGPINTDNKCAVRTLWVDNKREGAIVFPQRGKGEWSNWGYSSRQQIALAPGKHRFRLQFEPADENMNGDVNRALLDTLRLTRIASAVR